MSNEQGPRSIVQEQELRLMGIALLEKRINRLANRRFVLFPWLRIKWLLKKVRYLMG